MRQVIVRLRDCRPTYSKTIRIRYYYSQAQYKSQVFDDFKDLMPGQEIYVKIGNQYATFIEYEDVDECARIDDFTFDQELWHKLVDSHSILYYLRDYLPQY